MIILIIKKGGENKVKKGVENLTGKKITKNKDKTNDRLFKVWIECNHDGPVMYDRAGKDAEYIMIDDIEKKLGIDDLLIDYGCFPVWIDKKDYKVGEQGK